MLTEASTKFRFSRDVRLMQRDCNDDSSLQRALALTITSGRVTKRMCSKMTNERSAQKTPVTRMAEMEYPRKSSLSRGKQRRRKKARNGQVQRSHSKVSHPLLIRLRYHWALT